MGRTMPTECEHGKVLDWGDFGPDSRDGLVGAERCTKCGFGLDLNWWDRIGEMRWQHIVLALAALGAFVALAFAPPCTVRFSSTPTTPTTTTAR